MEHHAHRHLAERLWNSIAESEAEGLADLLHEKSVWRMGGRSPLAGTYVGADEVIRFMALVGDLATDLHSDLIDIFTSDRGAVMRYTISAVRGNRQIETEQLLLLEIENGEIVEGIFAPIDQLEYDRFFSPP